MNVVDWNHQSKAVREQLLRRPTVDDGGRREAVAAIIARVRDDGDAALRFYSREFDGVDIDQLAVPESAIYKAAASIDGGLAEALDRARHNLVRYHEATIPGAVEVETSPGVVCERMHRPIGRVGFYIPAGSAPLPSTVLMLAVPAVLAGCTDMVLCCPPNANGEVDSAVLAAAERCGIRQVFRVGGAQAIAAMAYGTESIPACDKLFGPGNAWVTEAKLQVSTDPDGAAIDMPAGPSEVLVIADAGADPDFVAADLLSQAEHGPDSQVIALADSADLLRRVEAAVDEQLERLARSSIATRALDHARLILVDDLAQAFEISNRYAPEHLIVQVDEPRRWLKSITAAGSVFLGPWSPESMGDYCSGTNHVLPTSGWARAFSGLSVGSFMTSISVQELTGRGLADLGPTAQAMARAEGLTAHEHAVTVRLDRLKETS